MQRENSSIGIPHKGGEGRMRARRPMTIKLFAFFVLLVTVLLTLLMSLFVQESIATSAENTFQNEVYALQNLVEDQLDQHVSVLYGAQGFFLASEYVSRSEWASFVSGFDLKRRYPAISGMAYIEHVYDNDIRSFEIDVRRDRSQQPEGYPQFEVYPEGPRDEYTVVKYIEPFDHYHQLMGMDAAAYEPELLGTIRDMGDLSSIGRFDIGNGEEYIFLLPIYEQASYKQTVLARRSSFQGFVGATLNPRKLLSNTFAIAPIDSDDIYVEMLDEEGSAFFSIGEKQQGEERVISKEVIISASGLEWTMRASAPQKHSLSGSEQKAPFLVLFAGLGLSLLLFMVLYLMANARQNALRLAGQMTSELGKFQLAVHNASNHIIITDVEGKILYANPAVERTTGYKPHEIIGENPRLWGGLMDESFYQKMWKTIRSERRPFTGEIRNKRKNGQEYDALIDISPIIDRHENLMGYVGIEEDITERKRLEEAKSEFVSLASHQLRTPLTALRLTFETLMKKSIGDINEKQRDLVVRSQEYAVRMAETIHTMLTISRLESGSVNMVSSEMNVCDFFHRIKREYEPETNRRTQQVTIRCDEKMPIVTDVKLLREIIVNLFSNAIKYTPEGGEVFLEAERSGDQLEIIVRDTGYGIPKDQQQRIFQKFFRANNILRKSTEGTGLGLYLVHSLAGLLGGTITFDSQENVGTRFKLSLPLTPPFHDGRKEDNTDR